MIIAGLCVLCVAAIYWALRMDAHEDRITREAERLSRQKRGDMRLIMALTDVTPQGDLVTPRGVELPLHEGWSDIDALQVLAEIEELG